MGDARRPLDQASQVSPRATRGPGLQGRAAGHHERDDRRRELLTEQERPHDRDERDRVDTDISSRRERTVRPRAARGRPAPRAPRSDPPRRDRRRGRRCPRRRWLRARIRQLHALSSKSYLSSALRQARVPAGSRPTPSAGSTPQAGYERQAGGRAGNTFVTCSRSGRLDAPSSGDCPRPSGLTLGSGVPHEYTARDRRV